MESEILEQKGFMLVPSHGSTYYYFGKKPLSSHYIRNREGDTEMAAAVRA